MEKELYNWSKTLKYSKIIYVPERAKIEVENYLQNNFKKFSNNKKFSISHDDKIKFL